MTKKQEKVIIDGINEKIDTSFVLIMAVELLIMHIGLIAIEIGVSRSRNTRSIIMRAVITMMICGVFYFLLGHNFANGNESGLVGTTTFDYFETDFSDFNYNRWVVGFVFCLVTNTLACSSFAERTFLDTYIFFTIVMSSILYPVIAHWVWGGGWLHQMGYHDHGGSGVIHLTAGCAGLIGNLFLGPRLGFYKSKIVEKRSFAYTRTQLLRSMKQEEKL